MIHLTYERPTAFFLLRKLQKIYVDASRRLARSDFRPAPGQRDANEYAVGSAHDAIVELERALNLEHDETYAAPDNWRRSLEEDPA